MVMYLPKVSYLVRGQELKLALSAQLGLLHHYCTRLLALWRPILHLSGHLQNLLMLRIERRRRGRKGTQLALPGPN